ncbi:CHAT domain-containing protein [Mycena galopus ATCC 62051]|nr:CHAT domain-containing protein [Mycena galopus ATCC 62051]
MATTCACTAHDLLKTYKAAGAIPKLTTVIYLFHCAARKWIPSGTNLAECLNYLATALLTGFTYTGDVQLLEKAICVRGAAHLDTELPEFVRAVDLGRLDKEDPHDLMQCAVNMFHDFNSALNQETLESATTMYQEALVSWPAAVSKPFKWLWELSQALLLLYNRTKDVTALDKAVSYLWQVYQMQPKRAICLLCAALITKDIRGMDSTNINKVTELGRQMSENHEVAEKSFLSAQDWLKVFRDSDNILNVDTAIKKCEDAESALSWGHSAREGVLGQLGQMLLIRFKHTGNAADLDRAIDVILEALDLGTPSHSNWDISINSLAEAYHARFVRKGNLEDIDAAIKLYRDALAVCCQGHPNHSSTLRSLGNAAKSRFRHGSCDINDINHAIQVYREALTIYSPGDPDRAILLYDLAHAIYLRSGEEKHAKDIDGSIELYREALQCVHQEQHTLHAQILHSLANMVRIRGQLQDIDEAVELTRQSLCLYPSNHRERPAALNNLAGMLCERFQRGGAFKDIDDSIELHRQLLLSLALDDPNRCGSLDNLANALCEQFGRQHDERVLEEAIALKRQVLVVCPSEHPQRANYHSNLASSLLIRFREYGNIKDINDAIDLYKITLSLCPHSHPDRGIFLNGFAIVSQELYVSQGNLEDIQKTVELHREALDSIHSQSHPDRAKWLSDLGNALFMVYANQKDERTLFDGITACQEAAKDLSSPPLTRFHFLYNWAKGASEHSHPSALVAYQKAIALLPQLAALHLDITSRHEIMTRDTVVWVVFLGATCAINQGQNHLALEFLEASRSLFWSQALQLRTPLERLAAAQPQLAARLSQLSRELEDSSFRDTSRILSNDARRAFSREAEGARCRKLNAEWAEIIKSVQQLRGFEDFMQPKSIKALKQAAVSGPIVIFIPSTSISFALVVTSSDEVQCVRLPLINRPGAELYADLAFALSKTGFDIDTFFASRVCEDTPTESSELMDRLLAKRKQRHQNTGSEDIFREYLELIWVEMVKPVFNVLGLKKSDTPSRLWLCPTGPFAFVPIHAAGRYREHGKDCVSDYVVPSYIPTLSALLNPPTDVPAVFKMTAVIEPHAPNCSPLPGTEAELACIKDKVPAGWFTSLVNTTEDAVIKHLQESSLVHFACHGLQDPTNPLNSGLMLSDGRLKVSRIMRRAGNETTNRRLNEMSLAFLSACETGKGETKTPDEAMHLAATLLFAGFRGVVATMWSMQDADGPKIANLFYEQIFKGCKAASDSRVLPDLTKAAEALHFAVGELRKEPDISFRRWVPFVYYGL